MALLHDDAVAAPGWLASLIGTAREVPHAGAVGGRIAFPDGRLQLTGCVLWDGTTTQIGWGEPDEPGRHANRRVVDYASSSSLLVRADAGDESGGPDQDPDCVLR